MKIDRLIGIITILLRTEKVTTAELAARFEVSQRTIQRDIETIGKAGIPILSMQGYGGGIAIAEGYKLDKTVLTQKEMSAIFMGLKGIDSISPAPYSQGLMERLTKEKQTLLTDHDRVRIHLSSFYQADLTEKIDVLKQAIRSQQHLSFYYYSEKGEGAHDRAVCHPLSMVRVVCVWLLSGSPSVQALQIESLRQAEKIRNAL